MLRQLPIMQCCIWSGTKVYSDQWAAYNNNRNIPGLVHQMVNHFLFFMNLVSGVHTMNIESYWNRMMQGEIKANERSSMQHAPRLSQWVHVVGVSQWEQVQRNIRWNCLAVWCLIDARGSYQKLVPLATNTNNKSLWQMKCLNKIITSLVYISKLWRDCTWILLQVLSSIRGGGGGLYVNWSSLSYLQGW